jgi:hypothetical protein
VIRLFDQIAVMPIDTFAMEHQHFAPGAGVKAVVDFYFGRVLMSSM